jgi:hypothetical protein
VADRQVVGQFAIILDWDGTLVEQAWPEMGDWIPGAVEAVKRLHETGRFHFKVFSARLSPYDPFTFEHRPDEVVVRELLTIRCMLDEAGLEYVDIWASEGKPGGDLYVDDKGLRFNNLPGEWSRLAEQIMRCGRS